MHSSTFGTLVEPQFLLFFQTHLEYIQFCQCEGVKTNSWQLVVGVCAISLSDFFTFFTTLKPTHGNWFWGSLAWLWGFVGVASWLWGSGNRDLCEIAFLPAIFLLLGEYFFPRNNASFLRETLTQRVTESTNYFSCLLQGHCSKMLKSLKYYAAQNL